MREREDVKRHTYALAHFVSAPALTSFFNPKFCLRGSMVPKDNKAVKPKQTAITPQNVTFSIVS